MCFSSGGGKLFDHQMERRGGQLQELKNSRLDLVSGQALQCANHHPHQPLPAHATNMSMSMFGEKQKWYYGKLPGKKAEKMLHKGKEGCFLVRESQSKPGDFVLSVKLDSDVLHVIIKCINERFDVVGGEQFASLAELLDYYKDNPMVETHSSKRVNLREPLGAGSAPVSSFSFGSLGSKTVKTLMKENGSLQANNNYECNLAEEFETLQRLECIQVYTRKEGQRPENRAKNRYKNILPYDYTRVVLKDSSAPGADYINANLITSETCNEAVLLDEKQQLAPSKGAPLCAKQYIACQGPLLNTVNDFWLMAFQQNCTIIVMITKEVEKGKIKCTRYWPDEGQTSDYGTIVVRTVAEKSSADFTLREFLVTNADKTQRVIYQYHFTSWPDHGVPTEPNPVLNLLRCVSSKYESLGHCGPIVVHCSAGIGRTGTFIAIDLLHEQIKLHGADKCKLDIKRVVHLIRKNREGLVQTEDQYKFVFLAGQQLLLEAASSSHHLSHQLNHHHRNPPNQMNSPTPVKEKAKSIFCFGSFL